MFKMIVDMASQDTGVAARALAQVIEAEAAHQDGETAGPAAGRQSRRTVSSRTQEDMARQEDKAPLSAPRSSAPRSTRRRRSQDRAVVLDK